MQENVYTRLYGPRNSDAHTHNYTVHMHTYAGTYVYIGRFLEVRTSCLYEETQMYTYVNTHVYIYTYVNTYRHVHEWDRCKYGYKWVDSQKCVPPAPGRIPDGSGRTRRGRDTRTRRRSAAGHVTTPCQCAYQGRDTGLFRKDVGLFCGDVGLFWISAGLLCRDIGLDCRHIGLFWGDVGLICGDKLYLLEQSLC